MGISEFTHGKPFVATEADCEFRWRCKPPGEGFRCGLCGERFRPGDTVRWQFTNDVPGAGGNPMVCESCDGTKEEICGKMKELRRMADIVRGW